MAVVPAGEFLERKKCKDRGGTWYSEPVKMCVSEDEVQIEVDSIECEPEDETISCILKHDGEKIGEIKTNFVKTEKHIELGLKEI